MRARQAASGAAIATLAASVLLLALATQHAPRPSSLLDPRDESGGRAVAWGRLDCYNRGAYYESAALGCAQAGGCDAWNRAHARPSFVPECGATSDVCVEAFKTCLTEKHPYTRRPVPTQCDCYPDTVSLGCSPACVDSIFQSFGELSQRCYNFNAYEGCLYIDGYRLPAERFMEETPSVYHPSVYVSEGQRPQQQQLEVVPTDSASTLKKTKSKKSKGKGKGMGKGKEEKKAKPAAAAKAEQPAAAAAGAEPAAPDPAPAVSQDEEDFPGDFWTPPADLSSAEPQYIFEAQPNYLDYDNVPERGLETAEYLARFGGAPPGLQRQPGGTYVQKDNGKTLMEPWQIQKNSYDQRWDQEWYDDDDPRE